MKQIGFLVLAGALLTSGPIATAAKNDHQHLDPFVNGPPGENRLIREVRHKLVTLPYFGVFDDLGFTINGSAVTLVGSVTNPVLKDNAVKAVKEIEGVDNVVNNIELLPVSSMDDQTRRAVFRAVYGDSSLSTRYGFQAIPSIHIIVKNGNVRLEGVVLNEMDRSIAGIRTNTVSGVFHVENDLQVESK